MRSEFKACRHAFFNKYILKRVPRIPSVHLHAGAAFAKGMEVARRAFYVDNCPHELAVAQGARALLDSYGEFDADDTTTKTAEGMCGALAYYFTIWPMDQDFVRPAIAGGKPMIECNFAIPLETRHPETGDPILYSGRFDMVGVNDGVNFIVDEKTTSSLGPTWGSRYELSAQFTGYTWAMQHFGVPVGGILIRGISILKTKYGHAQHIMYRPQHIIERWKRQLERDVRDMIACYEQSYWDYDYADACGSFGGCDYLSVCQTHEETEWLMSDNFTLNTYNPLK